MTGVMQIGTPIGVGIVGAGFWSKLVHIPSFQRLAGFKLIGVASSNEANAKATALATGIPKAFASYRELIADPDLPTERLLGAPEASN